MLLWGVQGATFVINSSSDSTVVVHSLHALLIQLSGLSDTLDVSSHAFLHHFLLHTA